MLSAYQTYGQPMFDTLESWVKLAMVRRVRAARKASSSDNLSVASGSDVEKAEMKGG